MSIADWIKTIPSIVTAITAIIAIIISVISLRATKRSIENANRPNVVAYLSWEWLDKNMREYLIIKNFGNTAAIIEEVRFSKEWINSHNEKPIFSKMNGYIIAPQQSYVSLSEDDATGEGKNRARTSNITMTILYSWDKGRKHDYFSHTFSAEAWKEFEVSRRGSGFTGENAELQEIIYRTSHELIRRNM